MDVSLHWIMIEFPYETSDFILDLNIREPLSKSPRTLLLSSIGVLEAESNGVTIYGPLDNLKASNLLHGPFGLMLTKIPKEHLTFGTDKSKPMLRILDLDDIFDYYSLQRSGVISYIS